MRSVKNRIINHGKINYNRDTMIDVFVKKKWTEENIIFYIQFKNGEAFRQIEITLHGKVFLSLEHPQEGESMLCDQSIDSLDLNEEDFITSEEFFAVWNNE